MRKGLVVVSLVIGVFFAGTVFAADEAETRRTAVVELKKGKPVEGRIAGYYDGKLIIEREGVLSQIDTGKIDRVTFTDRAPVDDPVGVRQQVRTLDGMSDARLILLVETGAKIHLQGIASDASTYAGSRLAGDSGWVVWERKANDIKFLDPSPDGDHDGDDWPSDLVLTFAISEDGVFCVGAKGPPDQVLSALSGSQFTGVENEATEAKEVWLDLDLKRNLLGCALQRYFQGSSESLVEKGYVKEGAPSSAEFYGASFQLYSDYQKEIFVVRSQFWLEHHDSPGGRIKAAVDRWSPQWDYGVLGAGSRSFRLHYEGREESCVSALACNDNGNSSEVSADGRTLARQRDFASTFRVVPGLYPSEVKLKGRIKWSVARPYFAMAVVADSLTVSDIHERNARGKRDPEDSIDGNPSPQIIKFKPGWNEEAKPVHVDVEISDARSDEDDGTEEGAQSASDIEVEIDGERFEITDSDGNLLSKGTVRPERTPYWPSGDHKITRHAVGDVDGDGQPEVVLGARHVKWYPAQVYAVETNGDPIGRYWHPGFIGALELHDVDDDGKKEIIVGATNNDIRGGNVNVPDVFCLDAVKMKGEAPPRKGKFGEGTEIWHTILDRHESAGIKSLEIDGEKLLCNTQRDGSGKEYAVDKRTGKRQ
ncbi:MAG: hypothetical protein ACOCR1_03325 [Planctomycetota bacterium]